MSEWTDEQIVEWVAIMTICLFVYFPHQMIEWSETSLGKLFALSIIVYYTMVDPLFGIVACCLIIVYYQLDLHKTNIAIHRDTILSEYMTTMTETISENNDGKRDLEDSFFKGYTQGESSVFSYTSFSEPVDYNENVLLRGSKKQELLNYFRKEHCDKNGKLKYKKNIVRPEMVEHVFREVKFNNEFAKCNPCDESCEFSIIEERLNKEEYLVRPTSSKNEEIDWNLFFGHYLVTPINSMVDDVFNMEHRIANFASQYSISGISKTNE